VTCPVCEVGVDIAARAAVTHGLYPVCGIGVDIVAVATALLEIRLHSKYRTLELYIYIYVCVCVCVCVKNFCN
jgi:hypothetical protein